MLLNWLPLSRLYLFWYHHAYLTPSILKLALYAHKSLLLDWHWVFTDLFTSSTAFGSFNLMFQQLLLLFFLIFLQFLGILFFFLFLLLHFPSLLLNCFILIIFEFRFFRMLALCFWVGDWLVGRIRQRRWGWNWRKKSHALVFGLVKGV